MAAFKLVTSLAALSLVIVACKNDEESNPDKACDDAVSAICDKIQECAPFAFRSGYVDRTQCITRTKINCTDSFKAPGTGQTPARVSQCASDAKAMSCAAALGRGLPASCSAAAGTLVDGAVCSLNEQCQHRLCRIPAGATCGACSTIATAGGDCERDGDCDTGLTCSAKKCVAYVQAGGSCSGSEPCNPTLACVDGRCVTPRRAGESCTYRNGENPCDLLTGQYCHPNTRVCTTITTAYPGESCELSLDTVRTCSAGECRRAAGATKGTCEAYAYDGARCDEDKGPTCLTPARCTNGICTIPNPLGCR